MEDGILEINAICKNVISMRRLNMNTEYYAIETFEFCHEYNEA